MEDTCAGVMPRTNAKPLGRLEQRDKIILELPFSLAALSFSCNNSNNTTSVKRDKNIIHWVLLRQSLSTIIKELPKIIKYGIIIHSDNSFYWAEATITIWLYFQGHKVPTLLYAKWRTRYKKEGMMSIIDRVRLLVIITAAVAFGYFLNNYRGATEPAQHIMRNGFYAGVAAMAAVLCLLALLRNVQRYASSFRQERRDNARRIRSVAPPRAS